MTEVTEAAGDDTPAKVTSQSWARLALQLVAVDRNNYVLKGDMILRGKNRFSLLVRKSKLLQH